MGSETFLNALECRVIEGELQRFLFEVRGGERERCNGGVKVKERIWFLFLKAAPSLL